MGFRRIRNQPKKLRTEHDKLQTTHKIPGFRQEVYHSTIRTGSIAYTEPSPDHPEYTTSPWDELRMNFHSFGSSLDGMVFKMLFQEKFPDRDPVTYGKNAWKNPIQQVDFRWARFHGGVKNYTEVDGTVRTQQTFNLVSDISGSGHGQIHRAQGAEDPPGYATDWVRTTGYYATTYPGGTWQWGEIRAPNIVKSTGGDGRYWFWILNEPGSPYPNFALSKVQVFKYGALVKEYPLAELHPPPVSGTVPSPNLDDSILQRSYWTRCYVRRASNTPVWYKRYSGTTGGAITDRYTTDNTTTPDWNTGSSYYHTEWIYYTRFLDSTSQWPRNWDRGPRGLGDDNIAHPGGNGFVNGHTPYFSFIPGNSSGILHNCALTIQHTATYTNPSNVTESDDYTS